MPALVQTLADGPLDIVGDVHGEIAALDSLMGYLGYDAQGRHAAGRRLVFVGDLTDRGPDSPAVVRRVESLVNSGRAQCVLGNHDFNILLGKRKFDNPWFYGDEFRTPEGALVPQVLADDADREVVLDFFRTLPLALERPGLRVIHACWDPPMIAVARRAASATKLFHDQRDRIKSEHARQPDRSDVECELDHQNHNPVTLLVSGPERRAAAPRESSGKLRRLERVPWWENYAAPEVCIFGHYGLPAGSPRGHGQALCVDYAVGKRCLERLAGVAAFSTRLAALRLPEREIVFDDGESQAWPTVRT